MPHHPTPAGPTARNHVRRRVVRYLAWASVVLMLAIIALSAYLRLKQAGLGCSGWPGCYGQILTAPDLGTAPAAIEPAVARARQGHRVAASAMLVLALALGVLAFGVRPRLRPEGRTALGVLVSTLGLAVLGIAARGSTLPAVVLGNLLGGFITLALCWRLATQAGGARTAPPSMRRWARITVLLVLLQAALGGLISATFGATACGNWPECARAASDAGWNWSMLNPWLGPTAEALATPYPRGAWLQWLHRIGAIVLLPAFAALLWTTLAARRRAMALALAGLLTLQLTLGFLMVPTALSLSQVLAHILTTALLLAVLARLA